MGNYTQKKLKNGVRVVLVPNEQTAAAVVLVLHEVGSRYETDKMAGTAHFIEHMMFKGTEKRPTNLQISRELDALGADYNAFTGRDCTGYYIKAVADQLPLAIEMLGDVLHNSTFPKEALEYERMVILEEIKMYEDNPLMQVGSLLEEELYRGAPLGRQIAGSLETVGGLSRADLIKFRDSYYVPDRTVVAIAGRFDEEEALSMVAEHFGGRAKKKGGAAFQKFDATKARYTCPRVKLQIKDLEQYHLALGFPSYGYGDKRLAALTLLSVILGGTMSSRLFTEVREKRGYAYFIRASASVYQDVGNLAIQAGIASDRLEDTLKVIFAELAKLKNKPVGAAELKRAKQFVKGKTVLHLEDSNDLAEWYARQDLLERRIESPESKLERIFAVTPADIQSAARDIIRKNRLTVAAIGPKADPSVIAKLAKQL